MAEKKDNVTSKFKDNVFCMLYRDKRNLLELYNALNNSAYTNVDDLQVTTLNGGSYMKYKNDASFLLCMSLYMFEQQSSKNPNMPLRFLHYVSDVFRELFSNSMLHRRSMIKIPVPHFVTFYNGLEKWMGVFAQAFKNVLPALANEFIVLLKETSISGYIGLNDLTRGGDIIRSITYDPMLPLIGVAIIYLVMVMGLSQLVKKLERRLRNNER